MPTKKKPVFDIISIGDAQLDTFIDVEQASVLHHEKSDASWLCLDYGDKISINKVESAVAGNAANVAMGASRLNLKSSFYTVVGDDDIGEKIIVTLKNEKVDLSYIAKDKKRPTNYSVVINHKGERTQLIYNEGRVYKLPLLAHARWIYLTAMGEGSSSIHKPLIEYLKKHGTKLAYNPGPHEFEDRAHMTDILEITDLLFVNKEEAKLILGIKNHNTIKQLLRELRHLGPSVVVITEGEGGATLFDGKTYLYMPIVKVPVVEKTGAGDSFATGVLSAIALDKDYEDAMCWGALNSASVIQFVGPQKGLLTTSRLRTLKNKHKKICAREI